MKLPVDGVVFFAQRLVAPAIATRVHCHLRQHIHTDIDTSRLQYT